MSKKKQEIWLFCESCHRLLYSRNLSDHRTLCGGIEEDVPDQSFIQDGVFQGTVVETNARMAAESKFPLPSRQDVALLSVHTMKASGICIGGKVLISSHDKKAVCIAWPSSGINPDCVALPQVCLLNCEASAGDFIQVCKLKKMSLHASKVELQLCNPVEFEVSRTFVNYCLQLLDGHNVFKGNILEVSYYGKPRHLRILTVRGQGEQSVRGQREEEPRSKYNIATHDEDTIGISLEKTSESRVFRELASAEDLTHKFDSLQLDSTGRNEDSDSPHEKECMQCGDTYIKGSENDSKTLDFVFEGSDSHKLQPFDSPVKVERKVPPRTNSKAFHVDAAEAAGNVEHAMNVTAKNMKSPQDNNTFYYISSMETSLVIHPHGSVMNIERQPRNNVTFNSIGGLGTQIQTVREMIEMPLKHPELFSSYGIPPPRGILLYGPSGTGKTMIARAVANEANVHFICINGPDVLSRYYGETEARLRDIFTVAQERAPSIVFIDELDALCPRRDKVQNEFEKRVVATILTLMDGMDTKSSSGHVMVLAATNRPDALDPALRRPGRFDREIEIGIPNVTDRRDIITTLLRNVPHSLRDDEITSFAESAHGYVGADLAAACKEAGLLAFKRCLSNHGNSPTQTPEVVDDRIKRELLVTNEDMRVAFRQVRPSAMREVAIHVPKVRWSDVGGNAVIKRKLQEAVEWPLKHPQAFERLGIRPPRGILMYGPPGCSKTLIARALANESGLNFIAVKGPELFSKWVGESERGVREVFRKARAAAPSIVFFDEIDAVAVHRGSDGDGHGSSVSDRVLTQLLTELDGVETLKDVILIAATNRPDMIDKALMRPGRVDRIIYVPLPDWDTREEILKIHLARTPCGKTVNVGDLVERTEGYSGAEIAAVCREAALAALQEDIQASDVKWSHFEKAFIAVKPRITSESIQFYEKFQQKSGIHTI